MTHCYYWPTWFYCTLQILWLFFYYLFLQIEDLLQSWIKQVYFPTEFAYFVLLCNILVTLKIFQTFKVLLYVLWWSVIFDATIVIVWGHYEPYLYKMANFIDKCCACSDCSNNQLFPTSPSTQASLFPENNNTETRPVNNPTMFNPKCSTCMALTSDKKLEMIQLSAESTTKADLDQKVGFLYQTAKLWMQKTSSWRKIKVLLHEYTNDNKAKQLYSTITI